MVFIGDSWTVGVGALPPNKDSPYCDWIAEINEHNYSYHLGVLYPSYDIINIGIEGASNESAIDAFVNFISIINEYKEVIVIFGLTAHHRNMFIFDDTEIPTDVGARTLTTAPQRAFYEHYVVNARNEYNDLYRVNKNIFMLQSICENYGFDLILFSAFTNDIFDECDHKSVITYSKLVNADNILHNYVDRAYKSIASYLLAVGKAYHSNAYFYFAKCGHPNERGYLVMARQIQKMLKHKGIE